MEDKSFSWILQTIAGRQNNLPILSTYIISDHKPISLISNIDNKLVISNPHVKTVKEIIIKLLSDHQFKSKVQNIGKIVCYAISKKERIRMSQGELEGWIEQGTPKNIAYIQPARPNADDVEVHYILRLEYTQSQYISHFFKQVNYEKNDYYEPRIFEFSCDIATTVMAIIENHTKKRVMIIEIEFLEDSNRNLWVSFFRDIKIAEPILCLHYSIKTPDDLKNIPIKSASKTKFTKLANGQHLLERRRDIKPPADYTFIKGHIRNRRSNLGTDLAILAPTSNQLEGTRSHSRIFVRSISIKKCGIRNSNSQPRQKNNLDAKRARALRDEIMKSPELKTKFRLTGLIGLIGVEMQQKLQRSASDSDLIEENEMKKLKHDRPKSRLVLKYDLSPKSVGRLTPRVLK